MFAMNGGEMIEVLSLSIILMVVIEAIWGRP
jgi:hypothetical protein